MLRRNGEDCEHPVPAFPGLLTTSEFKAYQAVLPAVTADLKALNERADILAKIASHIPAVAGQVADQSGLIQSPDWQPRHLLFQSPGSEMLVCARSVNGETQFGILEKLPTESPYAKIHGDSDLQMTGANLLSLLQNFVEAERGLLHFFRQDIEAKVEESLAETFPAQNNSRVVRAISAQCAPPAPAEQEAPKTTTSIRMKI